jgi:hypothetical protein
MAETAYDYSVSADFPYGVKPGMLQGQIEDSDIALDPVKVTRIGDTLQVWFPDPIDAGDQATLDEIVAEHRPSYDDPVTVSDLRRLVLEGDGTFVYIGDGDLTFLGEL